MRADASALPCPPFASPEFPLALGPNPIRSVAPAPDRRAGIAGASLVYLGMAMAGLGLSHLTPPSRSPRPVRTERWNIREVLPRPGATTPSPKVDRRPASAQTRTRDWMKQVEDLRVPERAPDRFPDGHNLATALYREGMAVGDGQLLGAEGGEGTGVFANSGTPPQVLELGHQAPAILRKAEPVYPQMARFARLEGTVELLLLVDEAGRPVEIRVLSGPAAFLAESERAVRQWRFSPATSNGTACPARFRLTLHFRLRA